MAKEEKKEEPVVIEQCGIIMPISAIDNCSAQHWGDVRAILNEAIGDAGFEPNLVSDSDDIGVIQKRIIQNLYDNPIVVCDVSGKNANVMFELGLRLAFDKPTIIIKDDKTSYSFDTSPIEHLEYPRDLRFSSIVEFKETLGSKLKATLAKSQSDDTYTPFLGHFGEFKIAKLEQREVTGDQFIIEQISNLQSEFSMLRRAIAKDNKQVASEQNRRRLTKGIGRRNQFLKILNNYCAIHALDIKEAFTDFGDMHRYIIDKTDFLSEFDSMTDLEDFLRNEQHFFEIVKP